MNLKKLPGSWISDGVVLDYDEFGNLVGIDIDQASTKLDMKEIVLGHLPLTSTHVLA